jgi:hypothetical protein
MKFRLYLSVLAILFSGFLTISEAQTDCVYEAQVECSTAMWGDEISWEITNEEGEIVLEGGNYSNYDAVTFTHCFDAGCYVLHLYDSFGDGWNGAFISLNFPEQGLMFGDMTIDYGSYAAFGLALGTECEDIDTGGGGTGGNTDVHGCTDPGASNFNPIATVDDGSCIYPCEDGGEQALLYLCTFSQGQNVALEITDEEGNVVYNGDNFSDFDIVYVDICLGEGCYTATLSNTAGESGWYNGYFYINYGWEQIIYTSLPDDATEWSFDFSVDGSCGDIFGCTDPDAPNYDPEATTDDGTCLPSCECDDEPLDPVCGLSWITGELITFDNPCELACAGAYFYWDGDCSEQPVYGCMDPDALNYNPEATVDSGCLYPIECTGNTTLLVYPEVSPIDGGGWGNYPLFSWYISGFNNTAWYNYVQYQDDSGNWVAEGCIEDGCYNFTVYNNGYAEIDGSIVAVLDGDTLTFDVPADAFQTTYGLGVNVDDCEPYVPGCTDEEALNYNPDATDDNGSCIYPLVCEEGEVPGQLYVCTFSQGAAVGLTIEDEDGNVLFDQQGFNDMAIVYIDVCVDSTACYTATMTNLYGDASWNGGYFYLNAGNAQLIYEYLDYSASSEMVQFSMDGNCGDVFGCTDEAAANYNPEATTDDGSCIYPVDCEGLITVSAELNGGTWVEEISWLLVGTDGAVVWEGQGSLFQAGVQAMEFCVPAGCYNLIMLDSFGDGWDSSVLTLSWETGALDFALENGNYGEVQFGIDSECDDQPDPIAGCTDGGAVNYDPAAAEDDGSCEFAFCPTNEVTFVTVTLEDGMSLGWNLSGGSDAVGGTIGGSFYASNTSHTYTACLADDCYEVTMWDMNADGWNGGWIEVWMDDEMMSTATLDEGFMDSMNLGINSSCDDVDDGGSPFDFPDPMGFAPYPNPTEGDTNLNGEGWDHHLPIDIEVRDVSGRLIQKRSFVPNNDPAQWILSTSSFEAGIYQVIGTQSSHSAHTTIIVR